MRYEFYEEIPCSFTPLIDRLKSEGILPNTEKLEQPLSDESLYLLKLLARKGLL